jgi:hypothetical protein
MIKQVKLEDRWGEDKTLKPVTILKKGKGKSLASILKQAKKT